MQIQIDSKNCLLELIAFKQIKLLKLITINFGLVRLWSPPRWPQERRCRGQNRRDESGTLCTILFHKMSNELRFLKLLTFKSKMIQNSNYVWTFKSQYVNLILHVEEGRRRITSSVACSASGEFPGRKTCFAFSKMTIIIDRTFHKFNIFNKFQNYNLYKTWIDEWNWNNLWLF